MVTPVWADFVSGSLSNTLNAISAGATQSMQSSGLTALPSVVDGVSRAKLVLDPFGAQGAPELVYVTSHAAASNTATVQRISGQPLRQHNSSEQWVHGPTAEDFSEFQGQLDNQFHTSEFTAAGQLLASVAAGDPQSIPIGSQWQTLVVDTAQATKLLYRYGPPFLCTSSTRPTLATGAFVGMHIFETNTLHTLVCTIADNPSTWKYVTAEPGTVRMTAGSTLEVGEVWCDGASYDGTLSAYAALFAKIGNQFGGAGSSFNVPDLRNRFVYGWDTANAGAAAVAGARGYRSGSTTKTIATANLAPHQHTLNSHAHTMSHNHAGSTAGVNTDEARIHRHNGTHMPGANIFLISPGGAQNHGVDSVLNNPIQAGDVTVTFTVSPDAHGDHAHAFTTGGPSSGSTAGSGLLTANSTGSGEAFDIMPPSVVLGFSIRL